MKIKKGFVLREVADNYVVVPTGKASINFNGMITLNETGAFLWKQLINVTTIETLVESLVREYEVNKKTAHQDVLRFINLLNGADLLE